MLAMGWGNSRVGDQGILRIVNVNGVREQGGAGNSREHQM